MALAGQKPLNVKKSRYKVNKCPKCGHPLLLTSVMHKKQPFCDKCGYVIV